MGSVVLKFGDTDAAVHFPHKCPVCHSLIDVSAYGNSRRGYDVELGFVCSEPACRRMFIAYYRFEAGKGVVLRATLPWSPDPAEFSAAIGQLSPKFVTIYREAQSAHAQNLTQVSGPGFRKAFEYLIKDYAKSLTPDSEAGAGIDKMLASQVVAKYISDPRIQAVAKRALWLGNDESHYSRIWTDHDIDDMLALIRLSVHWIEIDRLSAGYVEAMPEASKKD